MIKTESVDQAFDLLCTELLDKSQYTCSPRGQKIKEILACTVSVSNPRSRVVYNPARKTNIPFMVGEFLWYWSGAQDLESILYYNKRMSNYSDDGKTVNSAYGYRLKRKYFFCGEHQAGTGATQWNTAKKTLISDPDSRRAVLLINMPEDERQAQLIGSKDVPCTLSLQFFIRESKLHLHVVMRSNDLWWGFTNDAFSFTLLQECMLLDLKREEKFKNLSLGTYYHTAGSMHLYERHFSDAEDVTMACPYEVPSMPPLTSLEDLDRLVQKESLHRIPEFPYQLDVASYSGAEAWMAEQLNIHKEKRNKERENE